MIRSTRSRLRMGAAAVVSAMVLGAALAACSGSPAAGPSSAPPPGASGTAPSAPPSKPATSPSKPPAGDRVEIDVRIKNGKVDPSGKKIDVPLGATVVLNVTSDEDDEIHAHTGSGDGYSLEIKADRPAQGQFTVKDSGSFEVESHHLKKIIVILNVR